MVDVETALALIRDKPWHHDFEIIPGVRTHGAYDPAVLWQSLDLPADLTGLSVADVGASNGYFSFEAHRRGARVVAFDYRHKDNSGFGLAQRINGMTGIEHYQSNVVDLTPERYGRFDVVLALGLLYHLSAPFLALVRCAALSLDRLLVESYCLDSALPRKLRREPVMRFLSDCERFPERGHLNHDRSNFWAPTSACVQRMVEDVGFEVTRKEVAGDRVLVDARRAVEEGETRAHLAHGVLPAVPHKENSDEPDAWVIF